MATILKRAWTIKPEGRRLRLRRSHPLAEGLVAGWLMNELVGATVRDCTGQGHDGTIVGSSISRGGYPGAPKPYGSGLSFQGDGVADRVNLGSIAAGNRLMLDGNSFTVIWRSWTRGTTGASNAFPRLIDKSGGGINANGYTIWHDINVSPESWSVVIDGTGYTGPADGDAERGVWLHPAIVKDGNTALRWYNKPRAGLSQETTAGILSVPTLTTNAALGNWTQSTDREWDGLIEHVMVFDRVLSYPEIEYVRQAPYALFEPVPVRKRYFAMPGSQPPAPPSLGATDIFLNM